MSENPSGPAAPARTAATIDPIALSTFLLTSSATVIIYVGWVYTDSYLELFQLDASAIGYRLDEYALRGLNLFRPEVLPWLVVLPLVVLAAGLRRDVALRRRLLGGAGSGATALGLVLAAVALAGGSVNTILILLLIACGLPMLVALFRERPLGRVAFIMAAGVAILCLLWSAALFAQVRGAEAARAFAESLPRRTQVSIFAKDQLALNAVGVTRTDLPKGMYRYRYDGLRLLLSRESKHYLVPAMTYDQWRRGLGRVVLLSESESVRIELLPGVRSG
ncbi:hypothetical protein HCN51_01150 [Nonomuraea sp. FMUSA5-5]|uniref:Glycosyltransferase RgtA/B/C/D-like domain-containing protein n=1 Tax=Nonomuraea composti TaxID=2720023 RepID=A0ABX1AQZ7_9ACTN|nr:hypothetical protein [Nonomuraea sp. FMUSA5-5]NJP88075.1 hypothetical protein [Nonomuraea sp. FMUSA5-5]